MDTKNLKTKSQFSKVKKSKNKFFGGGVFLQANNRNDEQDYLRIGYVITAKQGNAVKRNRMHRRIKEAIRVVNKEKKLPENIKGHDMVVVANKKILEMEWQNLVNEIKTGMEVLANNTTKVQKRQGGQQGDEQRNKKNNG